MALVPHSRNGVSTAVLKDQGNGHADFEIGAVDPGEYELRIQSTRGYIVNSVLYIRSVKAGVSRDELLEDAQSYVPLVLGKVTRSASHPT